ncbi:MAG: prolyl oligopeptidase family serine peptidase [Bryobacterales bacterium]|nr:prolyl oligopeptidase family serine peptidase [Bryobacterales bacterium]
MTFPALFAAAAAAALTFYGVPARAPRPAVLVVGDTAAAADWAKLLASAGYAAFTVPYRDSYPAAVDDVIAAVTQLRRAPLPQWRVDPRRIALLGEGARHGLIANLAGIHAAARVQAVIAAAAPSDWRGGITPPDSLRAFLAPLIATRGWEGALAEASPALHIGADRPPPFLLIHGDGDADVPLGQATHWQSALQAAGGACNLIVIPGGGHVAAEWPRRRAWEREMIEWLDTVLAGAKVKRALH